MAEIEAKIETRQDTAAKLAAKLGTDTNIFDVVDRSSYASEDAYLDALTLEEMRRNNPEYRRIRSKLESQYRARMEQQQRAEQEAAYKEIRSAVQLNDVDLREIDAQAAARAREDLAAGRISASGLGKSIENYAKQEAERRRDIKAGRLLFNSMLRGQR